MSTIDQSGTFAFGDRNVRRLGYGAMQLAGPGVFGPPKDYDAALTVLREAVACGVNHIDTSDFYGPHVTNQIIREALHPYSDDLVIVTKVSARRGDDGSWIPAFSREELAQAVHDNLRNLALDVLEVVNLRSMFDALHPAEGSLEAPITALADLQRQGLVRHIGLSNVNPAQIAEARRNLRNRLRAELLQCGASRRRRANRRPCPRRHRLCAVLPTRRLHAASIFDAIGCGRAPRRHANAGRARLAASARAQHLAHPRHLVRHAFAGKSCRSQTQSAARCAHGAGWCGGHR